MSNLATKAPNFTPETARAAAIKSAESRKLNRQREIERLANERSIPDDARKEMTLRQIDRLDKLIGSALDADDANLFLKLAAAKEKLWKLVQPTAGVSHPGRSKRAEAPVAMPINTPTGSVSSQNNP
jgi:hypothetical protein